MKKKKRLLDSNKGQRISKRRTICEAIRELYDIFVVKHHDDTEFMDNAAPRLEEIFMMGVKMNKKLIEYKMDTDTLFELNTKDKKQIQKIREERIRLIKILEENKSILNEKLGKNIEK